MAPASAPPGHWTIADVVSAWAGEAQDYQYATNTCAAGKECGHYTQIVWRGTLRAGCAHRVCESRSIPRTRVSRPALWFVAPERLGRNTRPRSKCHPDRATRVFCVPNALTGRGTCFFFLESEL